jgi:hypothetical protein
LNAVLAKFTALPIEEMINDVRVTVKSIGGLVTSPEVKAALGSLDRSLAGFESVMSEIKDEAGPLLGSLRQTSEAADKAVNQASTTMRSIDELINRDSEVRPAIVTALKDLADASRSIKLLADFLERHPEALIRGKNASFR